ncbi:MAG: VCBS repeat-containing protein [Planctomycetaceae bacterium]|nr:VCBS repeat-containing protein [Planctomycetales bacterium]MCB9875448.1 VCBS repeat-containing protein [Planctomycetaceae bacterium]MCB9938038.1 VCBS repeat-containing protein [Planctomycetaceae bacterium]
MSRPRVLTVLLAIGLPLFVVASLLWLSGDRDHESALLEAGHRALVRGRFQEAEVYALEALDIQPNSVAGLALAAQATANADDYSKVEVYLARLDDCVLDTDSRVHEQLVRLAAALIDKHHLAMGERVLRFLVTEAPMNLAGRKKLAELLAMTGRRREAREHTMVVLMREPVTVHELVMAADDSNVFQDAAARLRQAYFRVPNDPIACLGVAWTEYQDRNPQDAEALCREALKCDPNLLDAHALLGNILLDRGDMPGLHAWSDLLPTAADEHDEIWAVRGMWLRDEGKNESAARCFWEAIRRNPNHRRANLELGKLLTNLGDPADAAPFLQRGDFLRRLQLEMNVFDSDELRETYTGLLSFANAVPTATTDAMKSIAELLEELQRDEETRAWAVTAQQLTPNLTWPANLMQRLAQSHRTSTTSEENPALRVDLSHLALSREIEPSVAQPTGNSKVAFSSNVQFADDAAQAGVRFTYFNGAHPEPGKSWQFEWPGGGNGVLDYDLDGWPEFYFPQGCPRMPYDDNHQYRDVLYRNLASGRFEDVSTSAGLGDRSFSHGCAVGDYDNDGFPDLYVCNLGQNRLYHNNGDGTFKDVTEQAGIQSNRWSTCAAIADLNGDGRPEIYEVNHMTMEAAVAELCMQGSVSMACQQGLKFEPGQDQLFSNRGDGTFSDITQESGIMAPLGFGLGIVTADFSGRGLLDLFIANDGYANFYFVNQTKQAGDQVKLRECAVTSGIAFDPNGAPQACMGVATTDADRDGLLDLFVTNYYNEANAFYRQTGADFFVDNTRPAGLFSPSFTLLGFGTQFIDGELDGLRDLIITNGDVDDFTESGRPYRQRPQYFQNVGGAKFSEITPDKLGSFFQREYLGRGLSRLDWNRDGREDCLISHLDSPVALLTNRTKSVGNYLAIQLRGTTSARDAVGACVTVKIGKESWVQSISAGDGYMASNQKQLVFGLGQHQLVDFLSIRWPSGITDDYENLPAGNELLFLEGMSGCNQIPR